MNIQKRLDKLQSQIQRLKNSLSQNDSDRVINARLQDLFDFMTLFEEDYEKEEYVYLYRTTDDAEVVHE